MENKPNNKSYKNMSCPTNLKRHGKLDEYLVEEGSPFCYFSAGTQTSNRGDGELPRPNYTISSAARKRKKNPLQGELSKFLDRVPT